MGVSRFRLEKMGVSLGCLGLWSEKVGVIRIDTALDTPVPEMFSVVALGAL